MRVAVIAAVLVAGCALDYPEIPPPPGAEEAIEIVHEHYSEVWGVHRVVRVRWSGESCLRSTDSGLCVNGEATSCGDIWVATGGTDSLADTSLAHEMAHCYAGHMTLFDKDSSHSEQWIWGEGGVKDWADSAISDAGL